jgi:predicted transcriptional regulator
MTIQCSDFDTLLLEGDPYSMEIAARHAQSCPTCAEKFASWNDITAIARELRATWSNDMLWPRIQRALRQEQRGNGARLWQIAAAIALFVGVGALVWTAHRQTQQQEFDNAIMRTAAVDEVEKAEQAHLNAIDHLEKIAQPKLDDASTSLMVSYREKLMLLDDAIKECQTNIERNRQNAHLRRQLLAIYSEKQRTLQDVLREDNHVSNQ